MSLLPQRKKSSAEIAQLRESFGIPGFPPAAPPAPPASTAPEIPGEANPDPPLIGSDQGHPLQPEAPSAPPPRAFKRVRSLRKSEQLPLSNTKTVPPPRDSPLPRQRHSEGEIQEFRRREALAMQSPVANPKLAAAHLALIIPGYLAALAGAAPIAYPALPLTIPAGCVATSLCVAGFIFLRKPLSLHHAAYIAVIALFVIVFGALHYFPQLGHAT